MPVATFSRRKSSRRQISSDIEDDRRSQLRVHERGEDVQPRHRPTNSTNREKIASTSGKQEIFNAGGEDDDDGDDDGRIDITDFSDQPLGRADLTKLQGIARDWDQMEKQVRQSWRVVGDAAVSMAESAEGDDAEKGLAELDIIMKDLIDISFEMQSHEKTIEDIVQKVGQGEEVDDAIKRYDEGVKVRMEQYTKRTTRQKYAKSEEYASFRHGIYEVQFPNEALPPITDLISKEDGDDSDDDDDLEIGGVMQVYTCPITLTALVNPVTSGICGHSFSADAIRQTFRGSITVRCPAAGCTKTFKQSDLKPNKELAKKVKAHERRARRAAENSDAEEIID